MSFIETPVFPTCPRFGYTSTPNYSCTISTTVSGRERRNRNWARPLLIFNIQVGPKMEEETEELLEFWHAMGGPECGFRFKDWSDYKSCRKSQTITATDQALTLIPGSPGGYQLQKTYRAGARATVRDILKPVQGTILIADGGTQKTEGADWVLDYSTGLLTLFFSPSGQITWGGEFDVPTRFDSEFPLELVTHRIEQVTLQLRELRDPTTED
jgi:uncharacterized protein (TIGR02217 family)